MRHASSPTALQYGDDSVAHGFNSATMGTFNEFIYKDDVFVYQPTAVLVYDGTAAEIPILFAETEKDGNYGLRYAYVNETGGHVKNDRWVGYSVADRSSTTFTEYVDFPTDSDLLNHTQYIRKEMTTLTANDNYTENGQSNDVNLQFFDAQAIHGGNSGYYNFKNSLSFSFDDDSEDVSATYSSFTWNYYAFYRNQGTGTPRIAEGDTELTTSNPVYVLNYKKLTDTITSTLDKYSDDDNILDTDSSASGFGDGSAANLFAALDQATSIDLTDSSKYAYSNGADNKAIFNTAAQDLSDAIEALNSAGGATGSIMTLKKAIEKYEANMKSNPFRKNLKSVYKEYLKAKEYYDAYMYGDKEALAADTDWMNALETFANTFSNDVTNQDVFATDTDGDGNYTATAYTGNYSPDSGSTASSANVSGKASGSTKFFEGDTVTGSNAYNSYYNTWGAAANILYYPYVSYDSPIHETDAGNNNSKSKFRFYYPSKMVLVYDGQTAAKFPVIMNFGKYGSGTNATRDFYYLIYPTSADATNTITQITTRVDISIGNKSEGNKLYGYTYNDSTEFGIRNTTVYPTKTDKQDGKNGIASGWQGGRVSTSGSANAEANTIQNWNNVFNMVGTFEGTGDIGGSQKTNTKLNKSGQYEIDDQSARLQVGSTNGGEGNYSAGAATSVEYKDSYFKTLNATDYDTTADDTFYKSYSTINWNVLWGRSSSTTVWQYYDVVGINSNIDVINTQPLTDTVQNYLLSNSSLKDILQYVYLYDGDASDYADLLDKVDAIGNFDPNNYNYNETVGESDSKLANTTNKGVYQCVKDMEDAIAKVKKVSESIATDASTATEGQVIAPTEDDKKIESTSTDTEKEKPTRGDDDSATSYWYNNIRNALMNTLTEDKCSAGTLWNNYVAALALARDAITNAVNVTTSSTDSSKTYYPQSYTYTDSDGNEKTETIQVISERLDAAREAYLNANAGEHTYKYADEDANQSSTWNCGYNSTHTHAAADMSAYNDLEIAYSTIDQSAYTNFTDNVKKAYDSAAKEDGDAKYTNSLDNNTATVDDYANLSFKQVKTDYAAKNTEGDAKSNNEVVQDFVDAGIANLLTAINTATGYDETTKEYTGLTKYHVVFNVVTEGVNDTSKSTVKLSGSSDTARTVYGQIVSGTVGDGGDIYGVEHPYGAFVTFDAADTDNSKVFNNNNAETYKWTVTTYSSDGKPVTKPFAPQDKDDPNTFSMLLQKDCVVTAYARPNKDTVKDVVSIVDTVGSLLNKVNANDTDTFTAAKTTKNVEKNDGTTETIDIIRITIGSKSYDIESSASYAVTDTLNINGKTAKLNVVSASADADTGNLVVSEDSSADKNAITFASVSELLEAYPSADGSIKIRALSKKQDKTDTIEAKGTGGTVYLDRQKNDDGTSKSVNTNLGTSGQVNYDDKVRVEYTTTEKTNSAYTDAGKLYAIAVDENQFSESGQTRYIAIKYANTAGSAITYYFYANHDVAFYPVYQYTTSTGSHVYIVDDGSDDGYTITNTTDRYYYNRTLPFVLSYVDETNIDGMYVFRIVYTSGLPDTLRITEHGMIYGYMNASKVSGISSSIFSSLVVGADDMVTSNLTTGYSDLGTLKTSAYTDSSSNTYSANYKIMQQISNVPANSESGQFSFSLKNKNYVYALGRGYVKYTYTYENKGKSAPIEAVSYGASDSHTGATTAAAE